MHSVSFLWALNKLELFYVPLYIPHFTVDFPGSMQTWLPVHPAVDVQVPKKVNH